MSWKLLGPFTHIEHTEVEFHVVEIGGAIYSHRTHRGGVSCRGNWWGHLLTQNTQR